jgi:hypothetical protein
LSDSCGAVERRGRLVVVWELEIVVSIFYGYRIGIGPIRIVALLGYGVISISPDINGIGYLVGPPDPAQQAVHENAKGRSNEHVSLPSSHLIKAEMPG